VSPLKVDAPFWDAKTIVTLLFTVSAPVFWYLGFVDQHNVATEVDLRRAFIVALIGALTMWPYHLWKYLHVRSAQRAEESRKSKPFVPKGGEEHWS
jgi:hypothetical protein